MCASFQINFVFKIELRKSIGLDEDIVEGMCLVSLVVKKVYKNSTAFSLSV